MFRRSAQVDWNANLRDRLWDALRQSLSGTQVILVVEMEAAVSIECSQIMTSSFDKCRNQNPNNTLNERTCDQPSISPAQPYIIDARWRLSLVEDLRRNEWLYFFRTNTRWQHHLLWKVNGQRPDVFPLIFPVNFFPPREREESLALAFFVCSIGFGPYST